MRYPNGTSFGVNKKGARRTSPRSEDRKREKKKEKRKEIYKWLYFEQIKIYIFLKPIFFTLSGFMWVILPSVTEMAPTLE